jgi:hypothetical protein
MSSLLQLKPSSQSLENWIVGNNFKGWDPFDALRSPLLKRTTFGNRRIGQFWVQLLKHSPLNFRKLLGVKPGYNPKAMGLFLAAYLRKAQMDKSQSNLEKVLFFSDWLQKNYTKGFHGHCWGYNFDWPNRGFFAPEGTPTIVNTAFIGLSFLRMHEFGRALDVQRGLQGHLDTGLKNARSACDFILSDLNVLEKKDGICFSYTPMDRRYVHNANVLGANLLAGVGSITGESRLSDAAILAAHYTVDRQMSDGGWLYGEDHRERWIDNFHTGYVLVSLKKISELLSITDFGDAIQRGYLFWKRNFLHSDGSISYYSNRKYPVDIHAISQTILTLLEFADQDPQALELAWCTARWAMSNMQDPQGYFYYQKHSAYVNKIPYMRWAQAWMFHALTELESCM